MKQIKQKTKQNITFTANTHLIHEARKKAAREQQSLNSLFLNWLREYTQPKPEPTSYTALMKKLEYVTPGRKFTRDEMNER